MKLSVRASNALRHRGLVKAGKVDWDRLVSLGWDDHMFCGHEDVWEALMHTPKIGPVTANEIIRAAHYEAFRRLGPGT